MATALGQVCSDTGKPEITNIDDCLEAREWIDTSQFLNQTSNPDPTSPTGCFVAVVSDLLSVVWNPVAQGQPDSNISAICLTSGK